jgi:hypothetical protein
VDKPPIAPIASWVPANNLMYNNAAFINGLNIQDIILNSNNDEASFNNSILYRAVIGYLSQQEQWGRATGP